MCSLLNAHASCLVRAAVKSATLDDDPEGLSESSVVMLCVVTSVSLD